jgi:hypothetical protein
MNGDVMKVEFLEDGSVKFSIDPVSNANHASAENLLKETIKSLGGDVVTTHKHGKKMHSHTHGAAHHHKH